MENEDTDKIAKILIVDKGKVLLLKSKKLQKFHLPGGHIHTNESFNQGLRREVKEETGLYVSWCKIVFSKFNFKLYKGGVYTGVVKISNEHDGFVWAKIEHAHRYNLCNYTKRDIDWLQKNWQQYKIRSKLVKKPLDNFEEIE
jgi:8-oxo-dGTP pyrophosphatase MutT (NUDIX family)